MSTQPNSDRHYAAVLLPKHTAISYCKLKQK